MTNKRILTLITLLLFLFLLVGCDWFLSNQPPVITTKALPDATVGVDYTFKIVATDPNPGDVLTYSLDDEPDSMLINGTSGVITWPLSTDSSVTAGEYSFTVVVSDDEGLSDSQEFTITVSEFVVELIGIEVDPKEMTLPLYGEGAFEVTAHYNNDDTADVTSVCAYGISDISIAKVNINDIGEVKALDVGIATISISYTERDITKTDAIEVTVTRVPMEITAYMPLFEVSAFTEEYYPAAVPEGAKDFTIKIVANSDVGKRVISSLTLPDGQPEIYCYIAYYDDVTKEWIQFKGWEEASDILFGNSEYPLCDEVWLFKGEFYDPGTYKIIAEVLTVEGIQLCSETISFVVEEPLEPPK